MKLAVFDIDGTLVRHSTERAFGRYLVRRGTIGPQQVLAFLTVGLRNLPTTRADTLKKNKGYLAGLAVDDVDRLAAAFVAAMPAGQFVAPALARLESHLQAGDRVALLSGTLDAIACALAGKLGAHCAVGTLCANRDGIFDAALPLMHPFGAEKREQTIRLARELGVPAADVVAYANSRDDLDLLRYAGTPVAVLPDRGLRAAAVKSGWEIVEDDRR